jgi:hypothetical protein
MTRSKFTSWTEFRDTLQGGLAAMLGMREGGGDVPAGYARRIKALYTRAGMDYTDFDRQSIAANVTDLDSFAEWQKGIKAMFLDMVARLGALSSELDVTVKPYNLDGVTLKATDWDGVHKVRLAIVEVLKLMGSHLTALESASVQQPPEPPPAPEETTVKPETKAKVEAPEAKPEVPEVTKAEVEAAVGNRLPTLSEVMDLVAENRRLVASFPALVAQVREAEDAKKGIEGVIKGIELEIQAAVSSELTEDGDRAFPNKESRKAEQYARTTAHEGFREYSQKLTKAEMDLVALEDQLDQLERELSNNRAILRIYEGVLKAAHLYIEGED